MFSSLTAVLLTACWVLSLDSITPEAFQCFCNEARVSGHTGSWMARACLWQHRLYYCLSLLSECYAVWYKVPRGHISRRWNSQHHSCPCVEVIPKQIKPWAVPLVSNQITTTQQWQIWLNLFSFQLDVWFTCCQMLWFSLLKLISREHSDSL